MSGLFDGQCCRPNGSLESASIFALNFVGEPTVTLFHRSVLMKSDTSTSLYRSVDTEMWYRADCAMVGMVHRPLATFRFHGGSIRAEPRQPQIVDEQPIR